MELLIIALIIAAVNAFFSNKKKSEQGAPPSGPAGNQQSNPSRSPNRNQGGFKRMEDYAKEIYGEFQAQMNTETDKKPQVKQAAKEVVERHTKSRPDRQPAAAAVDRATGRLSAHQKAASAPRVKPAPAKNLFPLTQSDAQRGIILAEVFLPPKAKRK